MRKTLGALATAAVLLTGCGVETEGVVPSAGQAPTTTSTPPWASEDTPPNCHPRVTYSDGVSSQVCWTPSTEESRASRVTLTPIECPADFLPTATCQMRSDGEMVSQGAHPPDWPPPPNRYVPPS